MTKRKPLAKRVRFEVLKRDAFKCVYCGASAPDVVLHVDHVIAVANGGDNSIANLVSACRDCNSGKGATPLDDQSAAAKQRRQLEELQERREQIDMILRWKKGLREIDNHAAMQCAEYFGSSFGLDCKRGGLVARESKRLLKRFSVHEICDAIDLAAARYQEPSQALDKLGGICFNRRKACQES